MAVAILTWQMSLQWQWQKTAIRSPTWFNRPTGPASAFVRTSPHSRAVRSSTCQPSHSKASDSAAHEGLFASDGLDEKPAPAIYETERLHRCHTFLPVQHGLRPGDPRSGQFQGQTWRGLELGS